MAFNVKKYSSILSFLIIPIINLYNPSLFSLMGSQPYWPIFWMLPWAIINGRYKSIVIALFLGLILDSINNDFYTQIPGLMICGYWFGRIGDDNKCNFSILQYGLTASIGSLACGLIYFSQIAIRYSWEYDAIWLLPYGIKTIFAQVLLTGLLAPAFCSWLYNLFDNKDQLKW